MKVTNHRIITTTLSLIALAFCAGVLSNSANTHAESSSANASVTVANTITLTLTGGDLVIDNLTPGNSADSNVITASVTSNSPYGFHLAATTGTSTGTDSLVNTADSNFTFTNLSTNKATLANFSDNTWGYSYSTDSGTTWVSGDYGQATAGYNGLPLDNNDSGATSTTLFNSNSYQDSQSVQFKIGAKSATTQAAGTYTGTVNFYAVTNPAPDNTMQGFAAGAASTTCAAMSIGDTITLTDSRDDQAYKVAKLADGKCWMLENLNLAGGTALDADKTDVTSAYISSFTTSNNLTKNSNTIVLPASNTSGFDTNNYSYVYNSGNKTNCGASGQNTPCYSYYSWDAATLGSGRTINTENADAEQSICPKGWKLPKSGADTNNGWKRGDFYALATAYGANLETNYYENSATFYNNAGPGTTPNFLLAGYYSYDSFGDGGSYGYYWSSTSGSNTDYARYLRFHSSSVSSAGNNGRYGGFSVRCLLQ